MTKVRDPLKVHGVILAAYDEIGGYAGAGVILNQRKDSWLRASADPDLKDRHKAMLTYEECRALTAAGVCAFVHDLARLAGMYALPLPSSGDVPLADLLGDAAKLMKEAGEAVGAVLAAHADGVITATEASDLKRELLEVNMIVHRLLTHIEKFGG